MASLLVLAPDPYEASALCDACGRTGLECRDVQIGSLTCTFAPSLDMLIATGGNGKAQFAVQAQYLLDRNPDARLLMCVGAAGRLSDAVAIGDLVVATATIEHDYKERFKPQPLPRHEADPGVLGAFKRIAEAARFPFTVHFGPIASGDEDIVDPVRGAELRLATDALCVAWEGSGGARAARMSGVAFLEIRGITDAADAHAARSFYDNVGSCMSNALDLLIEWRRAT